jgi:hypothetical protein
VVTVAAMAARGKCPFAMTIINAVPLHTGVERL